MYSLSAASAHAFPPPRHGTWDHLRIQEGSKSECHGAFAAPVVTEGRKGVLLIRHHFFFNVDLIFRLKINTWSWKIVWGLFFQAQEFLTDKDEEAACIVHPGELVGASVPHEGGDLPPRELSSHKARGVPSLWAGFGPQDPALPWGPTRYCRSRQGCLS